MKKIMLAVLLLGVIGCVLFAGIHFFWDVPWALSASIACGMVAYHTLIRFLSPAILAAVSSHKRVDYRSRWFQPKVWEKKLFAFLRVKKWKKHGLTYDPSEFSLKVHTPDEIVRNMCRTELVHKVNILLSFSSLLFAIPFGAFPVFLFTAIVASLLECPLIVIQRYNRPHVIKMIEKGA
ncbi:MAG: hypothetical protein JW780_08240 [Clostridiales bacterium]|nr:hypothetical protein [Clostridiales bacterium]